MENTKITNTPDISVATRVLASYKRAKRDIEEKLKREREVWHSIYSSGEPCSWIFNSIVNKHADVIDSIPKCTCLPREKRDEHSAEELSKIIPVITQRCNFEQTYSDNSWQKIRHGTAVYGVFWNTESLGGLGDVDIRAIDLSDIYWEIGVSSIQDSKHVFCVSMEDREKLSALYGHFDYSEQRESDSALTNLLGYATDDEKCLCVDWYYKKFDADGVQRLHFCKFVGDCVLYSSENDASLTEGWYAHGKYPFVFDRLYPCEDGLCGFGMIAIGTGVQSYINKLDSNIMSYSDWASRVRFWAKRSLGVNEKDFLDLDRSIVEVEGDIDEEKLRQIEISAMDDSIIDVKRLKIDELKEITGSRDVSQGGISGGVTAASAISILREAGAKASRDGIEETYRAYVEMISLVIELIRQFYDVARVFRIVGEDGERQYLSFSGRTLRESEGYRPFFDIEVNATRKTPTESQNKNDFAKQLFDSGAFKRENANQTLMMLDLMDFEGVGKLKASLRKQYGM
ncbi:MAG: hypothetical protein E7649_01445 [Ruminococcaceae bacterium]|nr:hypothetical protein [Oscillospiraceae bacterium]